MIAAVEKERLFILRYFVITDSIYQNVTIFHFEKNFGMINNTEPLRVHAMKDKTF